ncbi:MAG: hypothetical protein AAF532_08065 [Planctomycetota bacterium]
MRQTSPIGRLLLATTAATVLATLPGCSGSRLKGLAWWRSPEPAAAVDPFNNYQSEIDALAVAAAEPLTAPTDTQGPTETPATTSPNGLDELVASVESRRADLIRDDATGLLRPAAVTDDDLELTSQAMRRVGAFRPENPFAAIDRETGSVADVPVRPGPEEFPPAVAPASATAAPPATSGQNGRWSHDDFVAALTGEPGESVTGDRPVAAPTPALADNRFAPPVGMPELNETDPTRLTPQPTEQARITAVTPKAPHGPEDARARAAAEFGRFAIVPAVKAGREVADGTEGVFYPIVAANPARPVVAPRPDIRQTAMVVPDRRVDGANDAGWGVIESPPARPVTAPPVTADVPAIADPPVAAAISVSPRPMGPLAAGTVAPPSLGPPPAIAAVGTPTIADASDRAAATDVAPAITLDDVDFSLDEDETVGEVGPRSFSPVTVGLVLGTAVAAGLWVRRRRFD